MSDTYHANPALSATRLKAALISTPHRYWATYGPNGTPLVPTDPMRQGSLVDTMLLTPDKFQRRYEVLPEGVTLNQKAGKEMKAAAEAAGRELITWSWFETATAICTILRADPDAAPLIEHASQSSHFWTDPVAGECRYMPDIEAPGLLVDLKKTAGVSPRKFAAQAWEMAYDVQLAHYAAGHLDRYGSMPERVGFLCYEWAPVPDYGIYWITPDWLAIGEHRRQQAISRVRAYHAETYHPSYGQQNLILPNWAVVSDSTADF
jgi:hypothetical protein